MGNVESLSKITNSVMNESVTNILQRNSVNISTNIQSGQTAKFNVVGSNVECTDNQPLITQTLSANISMVDQVTSQTSNELKTLFQQAADSTSDQFQKVIQELGGGIGIEQSQQQNISNNIKNVIDTTVTQENLTDVARTVSVTQDGNVNIVGSNYRGPCAVSQNLALSMQASAIIGMLMKNVAENQAITDIINTASQKQTAELKGLSDIVASIGDAVAKIAISSMAPIIALAVGALIVLPVLGGGFGGKKEVKSADGKVQVPGTRLRTALIVFFVIFMLLAIIAVIMVITKSIPTKNEPPPDVVKKNCVTEYNRAVKVKTEITNATTQDEKNKIMLEEKETLNKYGDCMKKEESYYRGWHS